MKSLSSFSYKILTAFVIVVLALAVLPVTSAYAANCISAGDGNWTTITWTNCGGNPGGDPIAGDTVTIRNGDDVVLDTTTTIAGLTVGQGASGTLTLGNSNTDRTLTITGNTSVIAGATFTSAGNGGNVLNLGGNLSNAGTFDMNTAGDADTTFNGAANQTISGAGGTTDFNLITINNSGAVNNDIVEVTSTNFTVPGGFLTLNNGTFKVSGTFTLNNTIFGVAAYTIGAGNGIWLNNPNVTVAGQGGDVILNGTLRVTSGIYNVGTGNGDDLDVGANGASLIIEGGTLNVARRFSSDTGNTTNFNMSGGTFNLGIAGVNTGRSLFDLDAPTSTFTMSGGTIIIRVHNTGGPDFRNDSTTNTITGGTVQFGNATTAAGTTFQIATGAVLPSLTINSTNAPTVQLAGNITIQGDVNINSGATLNATNQNISVTGSWTRAGTFTPGTGTVTFNGTGAQTINGANTWYNLAVTGSAARTVSFQSGVTQAVTNSLTFTGALGNVLTLAATGGTPWQLNAPTTQSVSYVSASNSNASFGTTVNATNGTNNDGGGNTNWNFIPPTATTTTITTDTADPSVVGETITVTVTVTGGVTPTGTVNITGANTNCIITLASGTGSCNTVTFTSPGPKTLTATYNGDATHSTSSDTDPHTVNKADTTTTITNAVALGTPSVVGQAYPVAVSVAASAPGAGTPTGTVTVSDGTGATCNITLAGGAGNCNLTSTSPGNPKTITATYTSGDVNFNASPASAGVAHVVNKANTTTTINSDTPDASLSGATVTVTFTVAAVAPGAGTRTGNVTVADNVDLAATCTGAINGAGNGTCTLTGATALTTAGAHTLTATYAGDTNFNGSADTETHTVNATYNITVDTGTGGAITPPGTAGPNVGSVSVVSGADPVFDITPATGYIVLEVRENLTSGAACNSNVGRVNSHDFQDVDGNRRICATFDPGWSDPSNSSTGTGFSAWSNTADGNTSNNATAGTPILAGSVDYFTFGIPAIPAGSTIEGVQVSIEGSTDGSNVNVAISPSGAGGFATATSMATTFTGNASESTQVLGSTTDMTVWGNIGSWNVSSFLDANFRLRISAPALAQFSLDQVQVKVYYRQPTTLVVGPATGTYGGTVDLTATLTATLGGTPLSGQTINFFLNGNPTSPVGSAVTNASGVATLNLANAASLVGINAGTYGNGVSASYAGVTGSPGYAASNDTDQLIVNPATPTVSVTGGTFVYNGNSHAASGFAYGIGGVADVLTPAVTFNYVGTGATSYGPSSTAPTDVGTYNATASFAGNSNYTTALNTAAITITPAGSTTVVSCPVSEVYTGAAIEPCSVSVTGVGGLSLTPTPTYTNNVDVGTATASYIFAGDANHSGSNGSDTFEITQAPSTVIVTCPVSEVYTGAAIAPCTAEATGVGMTPVDVTASLVYTDNIIVGTATADASWAGDANHAGDTGSDTFEITPAGSTTVVSCPVSEVYTGTAIEPCTVSVTGVGGLSLTPTPTYTNNVDVGTATASYIFAGDANHSGSNGSDTFEITPAGSTTVVSCPVSEVYTGAAIEPCSVSVTGVGGLSLTPTPTYTNNVDVGTATASYIFAGDANHSGSNGSDTFEITPAGSTTVVSCPVSEVYTGAAIEPCTVSVTGVGGLSLTPTPTYTNNVDVGTATASYIFAGDANHSSSNGSDTFEITQAPSTVTVSCPVSEVYTGAAIAPCTAEATGVGMTPVDVTASLVYTDNIIVGTATADASWAGDANHAGDTGSDTFEITPAGSTTVVSCPVSEVYTGTAIEPCTVSVTGVGGLSLTPTPTYTNNVDVGTATASYIFAGDANHSGSNGSDTFEITPAGSTTVVSCPVSEVYTGAAIEPCSVSVTGVGGLSLTPTPTYTNNVDVGTATASYIFAGDANHSGSNGSDTFEITPAGSTTVVSCPVSEVYTGAAIEPCTVSVTGVGGLSLTPTPTYTNNVDVGTATASYIFAGDANHSGSNGSDTFEITQAAAIISVTGGTFTFDGNPHAATGFAYGVGGTADVLAPAVTFSYSGTGSTVYGPSAAAPTNVGTYDVTASFAGNANYSAASDTATIIVNPVGVTVSVTGGTFPYDATPHAATGFAYGLGGIADVQTPPVTFSYVGTGATTYGPTAVAPTDAGTYNATASFAGNANYLPASNFAAITITKRPIEVTAVTDTKPYDGNTSSVGVPTITNGTLVGTDDFTLTQTFDTKDAGVGKDLIPLAVISVGNANNYAITYVNDTSGEITSIPLTISGATANSRVYDGTTDTTINTGAATLNGVLGSDVVTLNSGGAAGTFADKNVGPLKAVTVTGFSISGANAGNYTLTQPLGLTANITVRPITVTAQTNTKVYDGTTSSAANPTISAGTLAAGDTANFTQTYDNKNVGTSKVLTPSGAVNDGNLGGNYSVTFANNGTGIITMRPLTIEAAPQAKALGAIDPPLTYSITAGSLIAPDTLSGSLTRVAGEGAGTYAIQQGSVSAGPNYDLTYMGANLVIGVGAQAITVVTPAPATAAYNTSFNVTATASSGLPVAITTTGSTACTGSGSTTATIFISSGTGTCTVHYNQAGDANFTAATPINQVVGPQKADQTILVNAPAVGTTAVYNTSFNAAANATSTLTVAYTSAGSCSNAGANFTMTSGTGNCTVTYNQPGDTNYNAAPPVTRTVAAQKANQTITITTNAPGTAAYGDNFTVAATAPGGPVTYSAAGSCTNAGATFTMTSGTVACTVQYNQAGNANYNAVAPQLTQTVNAAKAALTITASSNTMAFGSPVPTITPIYTGFVGGDNASVLTTAPTCVTAATSASPAGPYASTCSGAVAANYNITYIPGVVTVNAAGGATVSVTGGTFTYDGNTHGATGFAYGIGGVGDVQAPAVTFSYSGTGATVYGPTAVAPTNAGTYNVTASFAGNANYSAVSNTATITINKRSVTVTANAQSKALGDPDPALTYTNTALIGTDSITGALTRVAGETTGSYAIQQGSVSAGPNYNITYVGANLTIGLAGQTINVTTHAPSIATNGATFTVAATASSGLPVAITTSGDCSGSGSGSALITITAATGTCDVRYDQAGDGTTTAAAPRITDTVTIDSNAPTVTVNQAAAQIDPTNGAQINFTVVFGEAVTGFAPGDITISGTAGATIATIIGTGPTYNVAISGMANDGTVIISIPAGAVTDVSNNANAASTSTDNSVTYFDGVGPNVQVVNTTPETADHVLSNSETVTFDITQFQIQFNQDVYNPAGDSDADDVTNPNNYLLIRDLGDTAGVQTVTCAAGVVSPADTKIAIGTVTYDSQTHIATFTINGGLPLSNGDYHLFICGTTSIVDPLNNALALVGSSGAPSSDYRGSFSVNIAGNGGGTGGGGTSAGGGNSGNTADSSRPAATVTGLQIPVTGFNPNQVTVLPVQPEASAYAAMDDITIEIPSLGIKFPIVGVSVTDNGWNLTWLKDNVGYLEDSAYPTFNGNTVLTAHVRDANKNLGPFSDIKGLKLGDRILLHAYGKIYVYEVQENMKIKPNAISTAFKHEEYSWVTLVTCEDYNAKIEEYYYRRMVRAVLISVVPEK